MESRSWDANRFSASQDIPRILWNAKVYDRIHDSLHKNLSLASSVHSWPLILFIEELL